MDWHPHPDVWLLMVVLAAGYGLGCRRLQAGTRRQRGWFALGLAVLWLGADAPIHDLAERSLYSVHMVQHMLFTLVAPALLLLGTPPELARAILRPRPVRAVWKRLTRPLPALLLFNG